MKTLLAIFLLPTAYLPLNAMWTLTNGLQDDWPLNGYLGFALLVAFTWLTPAITFAIGVLTND